MLLSIYENDIDDKVLGEAFDATCRKRESEKLRLQGGEILAKIKDDMKLQELWKSYQKKYTYANDISFEDIIESAGLLMKKIMEA